MLAPEAREHYLVLGRRYTAAQVLEQANKAMGHAKRQLRDVIRQRTQTSNRLRALQAHVIAASSVASGGQATATISARSTSALPTNPGDGIITLMGIASMRLR
jgi:C4-dicarboxylate-specific signal transduction histidine kinase